MSDPSLPRLDAQALTELAQRTAGAPPCDLCAPLRHPGWESMPGAFDRQGLHHIGTLRDEHDEDPTLEEHHPNGTHGWSPDAPISPAHFPYNRCEVWECTHCQRLYLRYTEYGGYYHDERVRPVDPSLVVR